MLMRDTLGQAQEEDKVDALHHWKNETFPIHAANGEHVMDIDGCGVDLFGIINYSVHMLAYVHTKDGLRYRVAR